MGGEAFSYRTTKNGVVRIFWEGRCVTTLGGSRGDVLIAELTDADNDASNEKVQALPQRATGNLRRGNERRGRR